MNKSSISSLVAGAALAATMTMSASVAQAGWSANVGFVTDYRFRGVSQNDESIALQGGFDYAWDNGFYVGVWASSIDFQDAGAGGDNSSLEVDLYGGYGGDIGDTGISYDVGLLRYIYPNQTNAASDYDTTEIYGSLSYSYFTASLAHSSSLDFLAADDGTYVNLAADYEFDNGIGIGASVGSWSIDEKPGQASLDYDDWKVYVAKSFGGFDFELSYVDTDIRGGCGNSVAPFQCDGTAILAVSKSFE